MGLATVEYIIPASLCFGSDRLPDLLGRPAIDLQGSHLKVSSPALNVGFDQSGGKRDGLRSAGVFDRLRPTPVGREWRGLRIRAIADRFRSRWKAH